MPSLKWPLNAFFEKFLCAGEEHGDSFFPPKRTFLGHSTRQDFIGRYQTAAKWGSLRLAFSNNGEGNLGDTRSRTPVNLSRWQEVVQ